MVPLDGAGGADVGFEEKNRANQQCNEEGQEDEERTVPDDEIVGDDGFVERADGQVRGNPSPRPNEQPSFRPRREKAARKDEGQDGEGRQRGKGEEEREPGEEFAGAEDEELVFLEVAEEAPCLVHAGGGVERHQDAHDEVGGASRARAEDEDGEGHVEEGEGDPDDELGVDQRLHAPEEEEGTSHADRVAGSEGRLFLFVQGAPVEAGPVAGTR